MKLLKVPVKIICLPFKCITGPCKLALLVALIAAAVLLIVANKWILPLPDDPYKGSAAQANEAGLSAVRDVVNAGPNGKTAIGLRSTIDAGKDKPLVLYVHGMPGTGLDFETVAAKVTGATGVAVDRPGYGLSSKPAADGSKYNADDTARTYEQQVDALHRVIEKYGYAGRRQTVVVGHSYGGALAAGLAGKYPQDVSRALLLSPAGIGLKMPKVKIATAKAIQLMQWPIISQINHLFTSDLIKRSTAELNVKTAFDPDPVDAGFKERLKKLTLRDTDNASMASDYLEWDKVGEQKLEAYAPRIAAKTVVLTGKDDKLAKLPAVETLASRIPGVKLSVVSGGHMITYSHADLVTRLVQRMVEETNAVASKKSSKKARR